MNHEVYINPYNGLQLSLSLIGSKRGLTDDSGAFFPIVNDYPDFLADQELTGLNKKYEKFYNKVGKIAGAFEGFFSLFLNFTAMRKEWLQDIKVEEGYKVLEVSVGTGWNIKGLPKNARYYGLDISKGMLNKCIKNRRKWKLDLELCLGNGEYLPYPENYFNTVFHIGGINFFNNRERAITEMIRVAKPGTKIVIIDETEKDIKEQYQKIPFARKYFKNEDIDKDRLIAPIDLVPKEMLEKEVKIIDKGSMYQLSFIKP
jgi:ubiquinone/menaquinone biosynthesis C-methylase UbiE